MVQKSEIKHVHWQLADGQIEPCGGDIATGFADIHACIRRIILTPVGSVPINPLKGCDLLPAFDKPPEIAIPLICRAVWDALKIWEPRIECDKVSAEAISFYQFKIMAPWRVKGVIAVEIQQTELALSLEGGTVKEVGIS